MTDVSKASVWDAVWSPWGGASSIRDGKLWKIEDFHDAAMLAAFWQLVEMETAISTG